MNYVVKLQRLREIKVLHRVNFEFGRGEVTICRDPGQVRLLVWVQTSHGLELVWTQRCRSVYEADPIIRRIYKSEVKRAA